MGARPLGPNGIDGLFVPPDKANIIRQIGHCMGVTS